jgi:hypothetical protein
MKLSVCAENPQYGYSANNSSYGPQGKWNQPLRLSLTCCFLLHLPEAEVQMSVKLSKQWSDLVQSITPRHETVGYWAHAISHLTGLRLAGYVARTGKKRTLWKTKMEDNIKIHIRKACEDVSKLNKLSQDRVQCQAFCVHNKEEFLKNLSNLCEFPLL